MKTIADRKNIHPENVMKRYHYQDELTEKLDNHEGDYDQNIINEIVLWKLNRYAKIDDKSLNLLNEIDKNTRELDENLTREILSELLNTKGIKLPMASTILRFKNPYVYQIIDQRAYRYIYGKELKHSTKTDVEIEKYIDYLNKLKEVSKQFDIPFHQADRILYLLDKEENKNHKIR